MKWVKDNGVYVLSGGHYYWECIKRTTGIWTLYVDGRSLVGTFRTLAIAKEVAEFIEAAERR